MTPHHSLPEALAELEHAATWYEQQRQGLGLEPLAEYRTRVASAIEMLQAGAPAGRTRGGTDIRRFRLLRPLPRR